MFGRCGRRGRDAGVLACFRFAMTPLHATRLRCRWHRCGCLRHASLLVRCDANVRNLSSLVNSRFCSGRRVAQSEVALGLPHFVSVSLLCVLLPPCLGEETCGCRSKHEALFRRLGAPTHRPAMWLRAAQWDGSHDNRSPGATLWVRCPDKASPPSSALRGGSRTPTDDVCPGLAKRGRPRTPISGAPEQEFTQCQVG